MEQLSKEQYTIESLNKVILQGRVGSVATSTVGNKVLSLITVMTTTVMKDEEGPIIETSWFGVRYWGDSIPNKGDMIRVEGRLKSLVYVDSDRNERVSTQIIAQSLTILSTERKA